MSSKIKVGGVSYLNTVPLLYGIKNSPVFNDITLSVNYPSQLAKELKEGTIDVALLPVAAMQDIEDARIISDYGIAADGHVASVALFSMVPIEEVKTITLDYQSRTSVMLAQVLLKHYWKKDVELRQANEHYIEYINGENAAVIIGDRALKQRANFEYVYDLAEAWKDFTGLPFVFAAWISNKELPKDFIARFNEANSFGLNHIDDIVAETQFPYYDLEEYYKECIHYYLDDEKKKGLNKFLELVQTLQ